LNNQPATDTQVPLFSLAKSATRVKQLAVGGWQANLIGFYQSGVPFSVLNDVTPVPSNVSALISEDRPNVVAGASYAPSNQSYANWINFAAFTPQAVGKAGNEARAQLYGPHQRSIDFSLFKDFQLKERIRLQFRAEVYNLTNSENFGQPNLKINGWTSKVTGFNTGAPGASPTAAAQFGQITASNLALNPRQFQLALKLIF
jgi:hypothetical protein